MHSDEQIESWVNEIKKIFKDDARSKETASKLSGRCTFGRGLPIIKKLLDCSREQTLMCEKKGQATIE